MKEQISPVDIQSRQEIALSSGDVVKVHQKIVENNKTRIQIFEGVIIARKHGNEAGATFTVRRTGTDGIAIEKIYPLYSPLIDKIEVVKRTKTRRSKLYFLRNKTQKQVKDKLRRSKIVSEQTTSEAERIKRASEASKEVKAEETPAETKEETKTEMKAEVKTETEAKTENITETKAEEEK